MISGESGYFDDPPFFLSEPHQPLKFPTMFIWQVNHATGSFILGWLLFWWSLELCWRKLTATYIFSTRNKEEISCSQNLWT